MNTLCVTFTASAFNMIGLILNMIGSYRLYHIKFKPIEIKYNPNFDIIDYSGTNKGYEAISKAIEDTNIFNESIVTKTTIWFNVIVIGFIFQFLSMVIGFFA